ncbi:MAG: hypothetical protein BGO37_14565 [Cellulomonas sp. 73-92]|nr:MAG: hypothetical protein BGO37_14565 [Cellulomonas sp. 73-92]
MGVASAMVAGLVLVVVNPSLGDAAAANPTSSTAWQAAFARQVGPSQAVRADRAATRAGIADVATEAVAQVADVRARAVQAALPAEQLTTLDSLALQVNQLVAQVENPPRVSRSGERAADAPPSGSPSGTTGSTPSADAPAGAGRSGVAAGESGAVPTGGPSASTGPAAAPATSSSAGTASPGGATAPAPAGTPPTAGDTLAPTATPAPSAGTAPAPTGDATPAAGAGSGTDGSGPTTPQIVVTDAASVETALPAVTSADDPTAAALRAAVLALAQEVAQVSSAADDAVAQAAAAKAAADQAAAAQAAAQKAAWKVSLQGYANGRIPASALCAPDFAPTALLRCDATQAIDQLDAAFARAFGHDLTLDDSYRSYAAQVQCTRTRGWLCATPGTSNHGLGIAVDIGDAGAYGTAAYRWLTVNGPTYGWHNPAWALASGYKHEPWHWEYVG